MAGEQSVAELILKIIADSSEVRKALEESTAATKKFNSESKAATTDATKTAEEGLGRQAQATDKATKAANNYGGSLKMVARNLMMLGTLMSGPIIAAMAVSAKINGEAALAMGELGRVSQRFSNEIAKSALPVVVRFTETLQKAVDWMEKLSPAMKDFIIQTILVGGVTLIVVGTLVKFVFLFEKLGVIIKGLIPFMKGLGTTFIAALLNPLTWILTGLALFVTAYVQNWMGIRDMTNDIIQAIGKSMDWLYDRIMTFKLAMEYGEKGWSWSESWALAKADVAAARAQFDADSTSMEARARALADSLNATAEKIKKGGLFSLFSGGTAGGGGKNNIMSGFKQFTAGFKNGLEELKVSLTNFGEMGKNLATGMAQAMQSAFSDFFFDMFTGQMKSAMEYVADFGKAILRMIANIIAQIIAMIVVVTILNAIPGGSAILKMMGWGLGAAPTKHEGGFLAHAGAYIRKAHEGLGVGEVPIIAQQGEGVLSRNGMATLGSVENLNKLNAGESVGQGPTINLTQVIRAWGPEDVYRERKMLSAAMISELEHNGPFRTAMKRYR